MSTRVGFKARTVKTVQIRLRPGCNPKASQNGFLQLTLSGVQMFRIRGDVALVPQSIEYPGAEPIGADQWEWFGPDILAAVLLNGKELVAP